MLNGLTYKPHQRAQGDERWISICLDSHVSQHCSAMDKDGCFEHSPPHLPLYPAGSHLACFVFAIYVGVVMHHRVGLDHPSAF